MATLTYTNTTPTGLFDNTFVTSIINISGLNGQLITGVSMTVLGLEHNWLRDLDILLVAPDGRNLMVMSDMMGTDDAVYADVTFSDDGIVTLPTGSTATDLETGTYLPLAIDNTETLADYGLGAGILNHASGNGVISFASAFTNAAANGAWTLYLSDDSTIDGGSAAGWSLTVETDGNLVTVDGSASGDAILFNATSATGGTYQVTGQNQVGYADVEGFIINALDGNDIVIASDGNDTITGGGGQDSLYGGGGNDRFVIGTGDRTSAEIYDGGSGIDELRLEFTLSGNETYDLRGVQLGSIETIHWGAVSGGGSLTLEFLATQIWSGQLSSTVNMSGRAGFTDRVEFTMGAANFLDLSSVGFTGFSDATDRVSVRGDSSNETILGSSVADSISGYNGDDLIYGGVGNDSLYGGGGDDVFWGGAGADILSGSLGFDYARYDDANWGNLTIRLDDSSLNIGAAAVGDTYSSIEGLVGGTGNDAIHGDTSTNHLIGLGGNDSLYGGNANDTLEGGAGADLLDGGDGTDRVSYSGSATGLRVDLQVSATNTGIAAGDTFVSIEDIFGSALGDSLLGDTGANVIWGDGGNDIYLDGRIGNDTIYGGDGNDVMIGGWGADSLDGGAGIRDRVQYTDSSVGLRVDLQVSATNTGIAAGDVFAGVEDLYGSFHSDLLLGDAGANIIWGAGGNDGLYGRLGNDTLLGGAGADTFVFDSTLGAGNVDTILDYSVADDIIHLENAVFAALAAGALSAGAFVTGAAATAAGHPIIYNSATRALLYDADGNGGGAAVQFATLSAGLAMASTEFLVI